MNPNFPCQAARNEESCISGLNGNENEGRGAEGGQFSKTNSTKPHSGCRAKCLQSNWIVSFLLRKSPQQLGMYVLIAAFKLTLMTSLLHHRGSFLEGKKSQNLFIGSESSAFPKHNPMNIFPFFSIWHSGASRLAWCSYTRLFTSKSASLIVDCFQSKA